MSHELKAKYSARALAREWGWFEGKDRKRPDSKKVIRVLSKIRIRQHRGENGKALWFWTRDIQKHAPQLYEWWKEKRHAAEMAKIARGEAA
jgi:hypothetical protein